MKKAIVNSKSEWDQLCRDNGIQAPEPDEYPCSISYIGSIVVAYWYNTNDIVDAIFSSAGSL